MDENNNADISFGEALKRIRTEKGLSQYRLSELLFVERSSIANWESGRRVPDTIMALRIAECLGVDLSELVSIHPKENEKPVVILVDDENIILSGSLPVIKEVMPNADIEGFNSPVSALAFAGEKRVSIAFLDIEMGKMNGLELCRKLLELNPKTNVIFLTAYMDYSFDAWSTGACGFLMKPLLAGDIRRQLTLLRYPVGGL